MFGGVGAVTMVVIMYGITTVIDNGKICKIPVAREPEMNTFIVSILALTWAQYQY